MKTLLTGAAIALLSVTTALAAGSHTGGHGHDDKAAAGQHMAIGKPGMAADVSRTVEVEMLETDDGRMIFRPDRVDVKRGETVRFSLVNNGELEHEFVLDHMAANAEHKAMMAKFPEMEHDDPNAARLVPGATGEIIWTFTNDGGFEFACLIPGHYESGMRGDLSVIDTLATN
ncbi:cupredoxin family protein [Breoghania sp. L-A4]|uniref:cupredoxin domain-containing protein n=1 Tax=Breoghania sp. L-A4 TaxID=2304600 RepID=UPI000E35DE65|nr:cupredoxin family protein [Breoghania sp. L-A4]AXS42097.1 copper oxidase [Breoghania sp. L-A4]